MQCNCDWAFVQRRGGQFTIVPYPTAFGTSDLAKVVDALHLVGYWGQNNAIVSAAKLPPNKYPR